MLVIHWIGGVQTDCHLTVMWLTGDVTVSPSDVTFPGTTQAHSFAARLSALRDRLMSQRANLGQI